MYINMFVFMFLYISQRQLKLEATSFFTEYDSPLGIPLLYW